MLEAVGHLASLVTFLTHREARRRADVSTAEDLAWARSRRAGDLPAGLSLRWLGTAGFQLSYQGFDLLVDPYLTRLPMADVVMRRAVPPSSVIAERWAPRADAILIGHTHFDHALDAPEIARRTGCKVYGGGSLVQLMRLHGIPEQAALVAPYHTYAVGPFEVTFVPSAHSRLALGLWVPSDGEISCEHLDDMAPQRYRCGQVWGIHIAVGGATFYHAGSAGLVDDAMVHRGVDYLLCGLAGRRYTDRYLERVLRRLSPRVIVPMHYDDFFTPLGGELRFSFNVNFAGFADEVHAVDPDVEIRALEVGAVATGGVA